MGSFREEWVRFLLLFVKGSMEEAGHGVKIVVDGAWQEQSGRGVAAWCMEDQGMDQNNGGFSLVRALPSTGVEALAVLQALRWAKSCGMKVLQILTDSLEVVHALSRLEDANYSIRNIVLDIMDILSYFDHVYVIKATRQDVRPAHNLARSRLCNISD